MVVRTFCLLLACILIGDVAAAQDVPVFRPDLSQGLKQLNPIEPVPDPMRDYVTPQFAQPDKRDRMVVPTDLNKRRPRKLLPQDGDVRLRQQLEQLPVVRPPADAFPR